MVTAGGAAGKSGVEAAMRRLLPMWGSGAGCGAPGPHLRWPFGMRGSRRLRCGRREKSGRRLRYRRAEWGAAAGHW